MSEPNPQTVSLYILKALKKEGIDHVFLVPGAMIDPFLGDYTKAGLTPIIAAKEDGAAYMADGYGRAKRDFGVVMGIGGPGITNMITSISASYEDRSSILIIAGSIMFKWEGKGTFQDSTSTGVDDIALMKPITEFAEVFPRADKVDPFLRKAIQSMRGVQNRPAFLSAPLDLQQEPLSTTYIPMDRKEPPRVVDGIQVKEIPGLLTNSTLISILAGNGSMLSKADAELTQFANEYNIPVVTTTRAKGAISEEDPMSFGVFGVGGSLQANKIVMGSKKSNIPKPEILIMLGATPNEMNTHGWQPEFVPEKALIRIDVNPNNVTGVEYEEKFVTADVKTFLNWLKNNKQLFHDQLLKSLPTRKAWTDSIRKTPYYDTEADRKSNQIPMHPARVIAELRKAVPRNAVMVVDSGAHTYFTAHNWTSYASNEFLLLSTTGPLGYGISMGIGAKLARPEQPCVCVIGDGSMLEGGMELYTAVRYNIPLVIVIINNSALGNVYINLPKDDIAARDLTTIPTQDWAQVAKSLGAGGIIVTEPDKIQEAFSEALMANKPFVVDVRCDRNCMTPNTKEAM